MNKMKAEITITDIDFQPVRPNKGHIGFVSFILNRSIRLSGIAVYTRLNGGTRLVYPEKTIPNGTRIEYICPLTTECTKLLDNSVDEYVQALYNETTRNT